jgi:tetratricopeptide (TPR) repeat protein
MNVTTTVLLILVAGTPAAPDNTPVIERAEQLYEQGSVRYESADYEGAIEAFTEALKTIQDLPDADNEISLALLYNIASAHEKAYEIDHDATHLRQAVTLYKRYQDFADEKGDLKDQLDAGAKIARLRQVLDELKEAERPEPVTVVPATPERERDETLDWKRPRNLGLGLAVGGGVVTVTGIVLAAVGSTYEGNAEDEVAKLADMGVPPSHPAWEEGDDFIEAEARKGKTLMGVGGTVAVLGAAAAGTGVYYLVKATRLRGGRLSTSLAFGHNFIGVQLRGRF